ncbi:Protein export cytoplasm protein SecA ATPase RNA helicase [Dehalobacter sp. UNSWDHB]|jgi:Protein of unknown function (DUF3102).|uniref:DUF3102 domain-containing protein n=1 Tax=unclassified Dehalobacter TaxID=2635733 RepID=UPI00028AE5BF|nr:MULTISPECIES: DUF3102 domain-containing protein [unclassified Dehalobacter]AFV01522.1 Protein export cytoplasm protein SecA ATPase RNA helicase [Dehalobacter sp. DCA]AFV04556.1 Protein export cytoplasm protein SecA ATPase RNA helicase [Dehalobacter sp. CF]EQB20616.1 Protein export cytoplasm protein SecA ATPase RNA helicase [Dehalobacter sp. UNSWDHB]
MKVNHITDISVRTPDIIAGEIVAIKEQTKKILLVSAVEIGRRLMEAKEKIPYGEFVAWLENAVEYSESTAYKLMRIAEAYGPDLSGTADSGTTAPGVSEKIEPFAKLGYTQAFLLLGIPAEEREEFITQFDLENMAVRELQQAVNDRKQALAEKEALQKDRDAQKSTISKLSNELGQAKKEATDNLQAVWAEQGNVLKLQRKLDVLENENATAKRITEIELESKILKLNLSMTQADARFVLIAKGFDELFIAMSEMAAADPNAFKLYLIHTNQFISKMSKKLKRIEKAVPAAPEVPATPKAPAP